MTRAALCSTLVLIAATPAAAAQGALGSDLAWSVGLTGGVEASAIGMPAPGGLTGRVVDAATGEPLRAVQVFLQGTTRAALTAADGSFTLSELRPATYVVMAQSIGYRSDARPVQVVSGTSARLEIRLEELEVAALRIAEPWAPEDPADSLYRAGREALNRGDFARAAGIFREINQRHPGSVYAPDALYWEAFARQRLGGEAELRAALAALDVQRDRHPTAATRRDAEALATRLRGLQAELGDLQARADIARAASVAAVGSVAGVPPPRPGMPPPGSGMPPPGLGASRTTTADDGCDDGDRGVRTAALNALVRIDAAEAVAAVGEVLALRDDCSVPLRENALLLASRIGDPPAMSLLRRAAVDDPAPRIRESAVLTLSRAGGERDLLMRVAVRDTVGRVRSAAVTAFTRDAEPRELANLYAQLDDRQLRQTLVFVAARSEDPEARRWIRSIAADPSEPVEVRRDALAMFARNATVGEVIALYDQLDDPRLREPVLIALGQRVSDGAAFEKLMEVARSDQDPRLRQAAVLHLSRSDDPRVARVLRELTTP